MGPKVFSSLAFSSKSSAMGRVFDSFLGLNGFYGFLWEMETS